MEWDEVNGIWVNPVSLNLNSNASQARPPYAEFDLQERCIRAHIDKTLLSKYPKIWIRANTSGALDVKEDWYREVDSSTQTIVFPCDELFEHREYEDNIFTISIGGYEETIEIPPKIETLQMSVSTIGIEKSLLGQVVLVFTDVVLQSDFESEVIQELRLHLEQEAMIGFLEKISRAEIIELSEIRERFNLSNIQQLAKVKSMQIVLLDREGFTTFGFDSLFNSENSASYYCASFKEGKIKSEDLLVSEKSFSIRVGPKLSLTLYMLVNNHSQAPSVIRVLGSESSFISKESIPMYSGAKANSNISSAPSFEAVHFERDFVNFILLRTSSNGPLDLMLEVAVGKTPIIFKIPPPEDGVDYSVIIIPRKLRLREREYVVSIDNIKFVGDGEEHMCMSAEEYEIDFETFNEIDNDLEISQTHIEHRGVQRLMPEISLNGSKLKNKYFLGGYNEEYQRKSGRVYFVHKKLSFGMSTEIHLLSSKIVETGE
jgi:hypothetical protein